MLIVSRFDREPENLSTPVLPHVHSKVHHAHALFSEGSHYNGSNAHNAIPAGLQIDLERICHAKDTNDQVSNTQTCRGATAELMHATELLS